MLLNEEIDLLLKSANGILEMPGNPRYQPEELRPFLGYDQWAKWLVLVEWVWLKLLSRIGEVSQKHERFMEISDEDILGKLFSITTTSMDIVEKNTRHDILALLSLMRNILPQELHRYLHLSLTSYDVICTAYALQFRQVFQKIVWPKMIKIDEFWREKIKETAETVQIGRTHLQHALPITIGFWLATIHRRFVDSARVWRERMKELTGKCSGAVGTYAAQKAWLERRSTIEWSCAKIEETFLSMLELEPAGISTQIVSPEAMTRFLFEAFLLSGSLAQLGEDVRILQSSDIGELTSVSSSSSTMAHKKANPIVAENIAGMHILVFSELTKVMQIQVSDLQRDLRNSSVMRDFAAVLVYVFQQLKSTERILGSLKVDEGACMKNFDKSGKLVLGELLHLILQIGGYSNSHKFVNKVLVPGAASSGKDLATAMDEWLEEKGGKELEMAWNNVRSGELKGFFRNPKKYIGNAVEIALQEAENKL